MGGNYEKSIYNQLMEVMGRLDAVEKDLCHERRSIKVMWNALTPGSVT